MSEVNMVLQDVKTQAGVRVKVKAECGFMNEQTPLTFRQEQIFVCVLLERSDGLLVDFRRIRYGNHLLGLDKY